MAKQSDSTDRVFVIALEGQDADTAEPEDCAVHSGFDYPKTPEDREKYFTYVRSTPFATGTTNILTVALTDLNYKRCCVAWLDAGQVLDFVRENSYAPLPLSGYGWQVTCYCTETEFKVDVVNDTGAPLDLGTTTFKIKYQIWDNDTSGV